MKCHICNGTGEVPERKISKFEYYSMIVCFFFVCCIGVFYHFHAWRINKMVDFIIEHRHDPRVKKILDVWKDRD